MPLVPISGNTANNAEDCLRYSNGKGNQGHDRKNKCEMDGWFGRTVFEQGTAHAKANEKSDA
jgi:hypothetical protein